MNTPTTDLWQKMWEKNFPGKPLPPRPQREMKKKKTLYVRQLRADAEALFEQASELEKNWLEDFDDYKVMENQLSHIENIGAEVTELAENIAVLAQDLLKYSSENEPDPDMDQAQL